MKALKASQMSLHGVPGFNRSSVICRDDLQKSSSSVIACGTLTPTTHERPSSVYMPPGPLSSTRSAIWSPFWMTRFCKCLLPNFEGVPSGIEAHRYAVLRAMRHAVLLRYRCHLGVAHA